MAEQLKKQPGREIIKILVNKFGFAPRATKGSHVVLVKFVNSEKVGTVVPLHREIKISLLKEILKQAKLAEEEFARHQ